MRGDGEKTFVFIILLSFISSPLIVYFNCYSFNINRRIKDMLNLNKLSRPEDYLPLVEVLKQYCGENLESTLEDLLGVYIVLTQL